MVRYKLYYSPGACSLAVHAVLNAIGAEFELMNVAIDGTDNRTKEYLAMSPLGQVPVLVAGEQIWRESAAMMIGLLDGAKHPLLPQEGEARQKALQWLLFASSTLHQAYGAYFLMSKHLPGEAAAPALQLLSKRIHKLWRYVDSQIAGDFICGDQPTAGDVLMAVIANWSGLIVPAFELPGKVQALCRHAMALPYLAKAIEAEEIAYS